MVTIRYTLKCYIYKAYKHVFHVFPLVLSNKSCGWDAVVLLGLNRAATQFSAR